MKKIPYHKVLRLLMWLQVVTWPNLSFTVNYLSCFAANPGKAHWNAMKHAMAYVKEIINYRITYHHGASLQSVDFVNSDYANNKIIQRPTNRYIFFVGGELVL